MRAVNLLPGDEQRTRLGDKRAPVLVGAGGVAVVTVCAFLLAHSASSGLGGKRAELTAIEASIARLPTVQQPARAGGAIAQERTDRTTALADALSTRIAFDRLLRQVALVLPEDAWLTGLKAAAPETLAPAAGTSGSMPAPSQSQQGGAGSEQEVTIEGATYSQDSVALVLGRLAVVPTLQDVRLTSSALVEPESGQTEKAKGKKTKRVVTFTVTAGLRTRSSS